MNTRTPEHPNQPDRLSRPGAHGAPPRAKTLLPPPPRRATLRRGAARGRQPWRRSHSPLWRSPRRIMRRRRRKRHW